MAQNPISSLTLVVKKVEITPRNKDEMEVECEIQNYEISQVIDELDSKLLIDSLTARGALTMELFLKEFTLEDVFGEFTGSELKERLAKFLIN
jgi:hypothetical protein